MQLPVYSPLTLKALAMGMVSAAGVGHAALIVDAQLRSTFAPLALALLDSGTSALTLALRLAAARENDSLVALPAYGCYDLGTAALGCERSVLLYDLDPRTLAPDIDSLRLALAAGARTVVVVPWYGIPIAMQPVHAVAKEFGAVVIDDAAQGIGARLGPDPVGRGGAFGVLSFGRGKGVTGCGGGVLLAFAEWAAGALETALVDIPPAGRGAWGVTAGIGQWVFARPGWYRLPASISWLRLGETVYHPPRRPERQSTFSAGVLAVTLRYAEEEARIRRHNAAHWNGIRTTIAGEAIRPPAGSEPGYLRYPLLCRNGSRELSPRATAVGIMPGYPTTLAGVRALHPVIANAGAAMCGAGELVRRLVTLPTHSRLRPRDVERIGTWLSDPDRLR